jgi:hypothetical protein
MTDQEVERMLSVTLYRLGLDARARFYAEYLWWEKGEQAADEWIKRYKGSYDAPQPPGDDGPTWSGPYREARKAREEMEKFYRREPREIPVNLTRVEQTRWFNKELFTYQARIALLMRMLEMAGFPAPSPQFDDIERVAIGMLKERDREVYLNYLQAQSAFERMRKAIGIAIEGDGAEPMATGATIAKESGGPASCED